MLKFHAKSIYGPKRPKTRLLTADDLREIQLKCEESILQFTSLEHKARLFGYRTVIGIKVSDGDILRMTLTCDDFSGDLSNTDFIVDIPVRE